MATGAEARESPAQGYLALAMGTAIACYFIWAAFHDITRGEADTTTEYTFLGICAAWLLYVGVRLVATRHRLLGAVSLLALAAGAMGQRGVGAGTVPTVQPSYVATLGAFLWFLALAVILGALSWRASRGNARARTDRVR
jgi:hypothetical protein